MTRVFRRLLAIAPLLLVVLLAAAPALAAGSSRTLVVRGRVARADGSPAAGARVTAKGAMNVSALTDDRGRYSLRMVMGSPEGIRAGAFRAEVRAEEGGRKFALASGAPALVIEAAFVPGTSKLRVRSNSPSATAAVITSFAQEGVPTAWVDADFGGAVRATQSLELSAVDEVSLGGVAPAPAGPDPLRDRAPKPVAAPKPAPAKPAVVPAPTPTPVTRPVAVAKPAAPKPVVPDTAAIARAARRAEARARAAAERHTRDSLAAVRRKLDREEREQRDARAAAARAAAKPAPKPAVTPGVTPDDPPARRAPELEEDAAPVVAPPPAATPPTTAAPARPATPRVVTIEPFAPPPAGGAPDTCACRLRGTVEVDWERPLEKDVPVELTLEGPARQSTSVDLFMGPPREFRLGPLPCGEYRLIVKARGKYRYALVRGDSVLTLRCDGHTQSRVVLEPVRR